MTDHEVIEVPVFFQHNHERTIGTLRIDSAAVPAHPGFNFEIGYYKLPDGSIRLYEVSLCANRPVTPASE
jgi:hypothetical protein